MFATLVLLMVPNAVYGEFVVTHRPTQAIEAICCPDGSCPLVVTKKEAKPVVKLAETVKPINRSHWTYPGSIKSHLESSHGIPSRESDGMSVAQMETLHDQLHEGTAVYQVGLGITQRRSQRVSERVYEGTRLFGDREGKGVPVIRRLRNCGPFGCN